MISVASDTLQILVSRLTGSRVKALQADEECRQISIRLEEPLLQEIEELTKKTEGFSRNVVITFLLMAGLDLVRHQIQVIERQEEGE